MQLKTLLSISGQLPQLVTDYGLPQSLVDDSTIQQLVGGDFKVTLESKERKYMLYFSQQGLHHGMMHVPIHSQEED